MNESQTPNLITSEHSRKRILVAYFDSPRKIEIVRKLECGGLEIAYWLCISSKNVNGGTLSSRIRKEFPKTIFHTTFDLVRRRPASGVDINEFKPVDAVFLQRFLQYESHVLSMMGREDFNGRVSVLKKKNTYYWFVKYWHGVLTTQKIDAVFSMDIPHLSHWYVLYCVCRVLGIKCIMMRKTTTGRFLFTDNVERYENLERQIKENSGRSVAMDDLSPDMRSYYSAHIDAFLDPTPFFAKKEFTRTGDFRWRKPSGHSLVKHITSLTFLSAARTYLKHHIKFLASKHYLGEIEPFTYNGYHLKFLAWRWSRIKKRYKRRYKLLQTEADLSQKFIYVPLHSQPECTTSPMGGAFVDQTLMIDILSAALPQGWFLYVKEHPQQWVGPLMHVGRFDGYYDEIISRKNVRLVPVETSTYALIKNSRAVASVGSTACWEAVLRGIPALVFGYVWFMYCDGVFRVDTTESCKEAVQKIASGYTPDRSKVLQFFLSFDQVSFRGFHNKYWKTGLMSEISEEENADNIAHVFLREVMR